MRPYCRGKGLLPPHYNAGDRRSFHLRVGTEKQQHGGNKLRSPAVLSVTVNRATYPEWRGFKKELLYDETEVFYTVGTDVLGCPKRTTAGAVPGRNYKLLPALATNSPPDYSLHASRPTPYDRGQKCMTKLNYPIYTLLLAFN